MSTIVLPRIIKTLKEEYNFEKEFYFSDSSSALIIVDIQYDFLTGGSLAVENGNEIIPIINALQNHFSLVVATQDWHPDNHKSFASNHEDKNEFEIIDLNGNEQVLWPNHCVQGTDGALFFSELNEKRIEAIFRKGMDREIDSYSGFYDNGRKKNTGMAGYLKDRKIKNIFICGIASDFCVYYTALDGLSLDFNVFVVEDASRAINEAGNKEAMADLRAKGAKIISSKEVLT